MYIVFRHFENKAASMFYHRYYLNYIHGSRIMFYVSSIRSRTRHTLSMEIAFKWTIRTIPKYSKSPDIDSLGFKNKPTTSFRIYISVLFWRTQCKVELSRWGHRVSKGLRRTKPITITLTTGFG